LGPIYISDNVEDGKKDYEAFFPEDEEKEDFSPEKPEKTSKLEVTIPQFKGQDGDEMSEHTCEKGETSVPQNNEGGSGISSTLGQTPSSKVGDEQTPAQEAVNPEA
jgi:hypothetical protein